MLLLFGIGVALYGLADLTHADPFLAAFAGGVTCATVLAHSGHTADQVGEEVSEATKLLALLVFGALLTQNCWTRSRSAAGFWHCYRWCSYGRSRS